MANGCPCDLVAKCWAAVDSSDSATTSGGGNGKIDKDSSAGKASFHHNHTTIISILFACVLVCHTKFCMLIWVVCSVIVDHFFVAQFVVDFWLQSGGWEWGGGGGGAGDWRMPHASG